LKKHTEVTNSKRLCFCLFRAFAPIFTSNFKKADKYLAATEIFFAPPPPLAGYDPGLVSLNHVSCMIIVCVKPAEYIQ